MTAGGCLSNESHRVHTPTTRLLRCSVCGRVWKWSQTGDALPFHYPEPNPLDLDQLKAGIEPEEWTTTWTA